MSERPSEADWASTTDTLRWLYQQTGNEDVQFVSNLLDEEMRAEVRINLAEAPCHFCGRTIGVTGVVAMDEEGPYHYGGCPELTEQETEE